MALTTEELNTIVQQVMAQIENNALDFDVQITEPEDSDYLMASRLKSDGTYSGIIIKWQDVAKVVTDVAVQAKTDAINAKDIAQQILTQVQSKGTEITNFVATSKTEIATAKTEAVNAVKSVYQTDLNASNARIAALESENAVQKGQIANQKYEIENLKAKAEGQIYREEIVDANTYKLDIPSSVAPYAEVQKVGGKSVVWNQLVKNGNFDNYSNWNISSVSDKSVSNGELTLVPSANTTILLQETVKGKIDHIIYVSMGIKSNQTVSVTIQNSLVRLRMTYNATGSWVTLHGIYKSVENTEYLCVNNSDYTKGSVYVKSPLAIDLTQMFGSGNEPTLEECKKIFSADYYPYDAGTIKSFPVRTVRSVNAEGTEIGSIDVSSFTSDFKSAGSAHDEWSNGKKIKRVGERAYTSGDESESGYITDGTTTYYPLATPTEETIPEIDNYIEVEGGGTLTFESDATISMPVPSTTRFVIDLT